MAYALAWLVYVVMAVLIMAGFERYLSGHCSRQWRIFVRALLAIVFFTPGVVTPVVATAGGTYIVPACIGMLFNLLAKSGDGFIKAGLPILTVAVLVFGGLFFRESRRAPDAGDAENVEDRESPSA